MTAKAGKAFDSIIYNSFINTPKLSKAKFTVYSITAMGTNGIRAVRV